MSRKKSGPDSGAGAAKAARFSRPVRRTDRAVSRTVPAVNLLSPWVFEEIRVRTLRRRFVAAAGALVLLVGAGYALQTYRLAGAAEDLLAKEQAGIELNARIGELTPVSDFVGDVADRADLIDTTMRTEIAYSRILGKVRATAPSGVSIDLLAANIPSPTAPLPGDPAEVTRGLSTSCGGPDPFAVREVVACLSLSGTARDRQSVGALVDALDAEGLFVEPFVSSTNTSPNSPVSFSGTVGISPEAFAGRYDTLLSETTGESPQDAEEAR